METNEKKVTVIPLEKLDPFPNHPFYVRDDDQMRELMESIRQVGVLSPIIVRQTEEGGYQIISGHRRKRACELLGIKEIPAVIREIDLDTATLQMVDSVRP